MLSTARQAWRSQAILRRAQPRAGSAGAEQGVRVNVIAIPRLDHAWPFIAAFPRLDHAWSFGVTGRGRLFGAGGTDFLNAIFRRERVSGTRCANLLGADDWVFWTLPRLDHAGGRLLCGCRSSRRHGEREDRGTKHEQADTDPAKVFAMTLAHNASLWRQRSSKYITTRVSKGRSFLACLQYSVKGGRLEKPLA